MTKDLIIVGLVTLSIMLGYALFVTRTDGNSQTLQPAQAVNTGQIVAADVIAVQPEGDTAMSSPLPGALIAGSSYQDLATGLKGLGFADDLVRQIILARMTSDRLAQERRTSQPYWQKQSGNQTELTGQKLAFQAQTRLALVEIFGAEIVDDPLFETLFKPMNESLSFLTSEKQVAIYELQEKNRAALADRDRMGSSRESRLEIRDQIQQHQDSITSLLSVDENLEYQLRVSRLANTMRESMHGFDYSEQEFRDLYLIRDQVFSDGTEINSREELLSLRQAQEQRIQEYLGDERFREYQRSQDPAFHQITSIGERYGNSDSEIIEAYEQTRKVREEIATLQQDRSLTRENIRSQVQARQSALIESITAIAGEETARSISDNIRVSRNNRRPPNFRR